MARKGGAKHQPRGLDLLYEDQDVVVIAKPSGLPTIGTARDKTRTVHAILNDYVRKGNPSGARGRSGSRAIPAARAATSPWCGTGPVSAA